MVSSVRGRRAWVALLGLVFLASTAEKCAGDKPAVVSHLKGNIVSSKVNGNSYEVTLGSSGLRILDAAEAGLLAAPPRLDQPDSSAFELHFVGLNVHRSETDPIAYVSDVDGDGRPDLRVSFPTSEPGFDVVLNSPDLGASSGECVTGRVYVRFTGDSTTDVHSHVVDWCVAPPTSGSAEAGR